MTPDLRPYFALADALLSRRLTTSEFQAILLPLFKGDQMVRPTEIYELLNSMFLAVEAYEPNGVNSDKFAVGSDEVYEVVAESYQRLRKLIDEGPSDWVP